MTRKLIAELLGTAILVFFGCGTAALMLGMHLAGVWGAGVVVTALAFGLVLGGICYAFGAVSGAHVNPAVTLGALVAGRIKAIEAVWYWGAQFVGGILGVLVLWAMLSGSPYFSRTRTGLGANGYGSLSLIHMNWSGAFVIEIVMTAVFVYVILAVTAKAGAPIVAGLVIGLTLATVHLLGISVDGTSVNPARSLAPALIVGGTALKQVWLFICAPLVGGLLAAAVYRAMHPDEVDTVFDDEDDAPSGTDATGAAAEIEPEPAIPSA